MSKLTNTQKVTSVAAAVTAAMAGYTTAQAQLEEIVVTATKKSESLQDIAGSVQAITEDTLKKANIIGMEDYAKLIPSMSYVNYTPGTGKVYFRGIADDNGTFISEESSALYLNEQPITQAGMAADVRMVDVNRIEALAGPQGTLYGSSAQSGAIRIITNKPDTSEFSAVGDITLKMMDEGESSYDVSGVVNVPISDNFAIRAVGFTAEDGGFVDVVDGQSARFGLNNNSTFNPGVVRNDVNTFKSTGGRLAAQWDMDDGYYLFELATQNNSADGYSYFDPSVGDLQRVSFYDEPRDDDWTQIAFTIEKDLGWATLISATSYFDRDVFYVNDRTTYSMYFGTFCYYYNGYASTSRYCFQPVGVSYAYNDVPGFNILDQWNSSKTQEFRLSNQTDDLDWIVGLFYQEREEGWDFETETHNYRNSLGYANQMNYVSTYLPDRLPVAPNDIWWASYDRTEWETMAVFGEVNYRFDENWELTVGGRYFDREADKRYWVENPKGALAADGVLPKRKADNPGDSDFVPKVSVKYNVDDDTMVYGLYSEGYRPGGVNRGRSSAPFYPDVYESDYLENTELGLKTTLMDGNMQLNITYFTMDWNNYQLEVVDPSNLPCGSAGAYPAPQCGQPWQKVVANVGEASSDGLQLETLNAVGDNMEIGFNAQWVTAELDEDLSDGSAPAGSRLPQVPEFKANLWMDTSIDTQMMGANEGFFRASVSYTGDTVSAVQPGSQFTQKSYKSIDLKYGLMGDDWEVNLFINNVSDERADIAVNDWFFDFFFGNARQYVNRPREVGVRYVKRW